MAHICRSTWHASYHLRFFLFLLYCSEETLLLLFFGWLRCIQHYSIWASPENKTKATEPDVPTKNLYNIFKLPMRPCYVTSVEFNRPENCFTEQCTTLDVVKVTSGREEQHELRCVVVSRDTHQGSNAGWRLEWFVPSPDMPEPRLWPRLSWKELSGRGEGTVQQTQQIRSITFWYKEKNTKS